MLGWLRDVLGINKYVLVWKVPFKTWTMEGRDDDHKTSKRFAERMAAGMNRDYGAGTHWIERA